MVHIASSIIYKPNKINSSHKSQLASLQDDQALTTILPEYFDCTEILSLNLAITLSVYMMIMNYAINLIHGKQLPYRRI